jgi:hypothetical protein
VDQDLGQEMRRVVRGTQALALGLYFGGILSLLSYHLVYQLSFVSIHINDVKRYFGFWLSFSQ